MFLIIDQAGGHERLQGDQEGGVSLGGGGEAWSPAG